MVGVDVWVKAGTSTETKETNGVSHFIEHLIYDSTSKRQVGTADFEMECLGATLNAYTGRDWAHYSTTVKNIISYKGFRCYV